MTLQLVADDLTPLPPIFSHLRLVEAPPDEPEVTYITVTAPAPQIKITEAGGYDAYPASLFPGQVDRLRNHPHPQTPDAIMAIETFLLGNPTFPGGIIVSGGNVSVTPPGAFVGNGSVPPGGLAGQVLTKQSNADYSLVWTTPSTGGAGISLPLGQDLTFAPDNTYNVGAAAASRPATINAGTNVISPLVTTPQINNPGGNIVIGQNPTGWRFLSTGALVPLTDSTQDLGASPTRVNTVWAMTVRAATAFIGPGALPTGGTTGQALTKTSNADYAVAWSTVLTQTAANALYAPIAAAVPAGGTTGQVLSKSANTDYALTWITPPTGVAWALQAPDGSVSDPQYSWVNQPTSGLYLDSGLLLGITTGGVRRATFGGVATLYTNLQFSADNTRDIGASAATRPRTVYAGTSLVAPEADVSNVWTPSAVLGFGDTTNGTRWRIMSSDGSFQPFYDNLYNVGTPTQRPHIVYAATAFLGPGALPVGGLSGQVLQKATATDYDVIWQTPAAGGGGGGGTASVLVYETQNITASTVTLPFVPMMNGVVNVSVNGQSLLQTRDWTISGSLITFTTALSADDVHVEYQMAGFNASGYAGHYETTLSVGQSTITLPSAPAGTPLLTRGGVTQYQSAGQYSVSGSTITLAAPIQTGEDGRISVDFVAGSTFPTTQVFHEEFLPTNGATTITVSQPPGVLLAISRAGVVQSGVDGHYTISGAVITFTDAFNGAERVIVLYTLLAAVGAATTLQGFTATSAAVATPGTLVATDSAGKLPASTQTAIANLLVNGGFEIWQRGNGPFTGPGIMADRWQNYVPAGTTLSFSKDTANADAGSVACASCVVGGTVSTGNSVLVQQQPITALDGGAQFATRTLTLSIRVKTSVPNGARIWIQSVNGSPDVRGSYHTGNGQYQTLTATMVLGNSPANQVAIFNIEFTVAGTYYLDNAMLVTGAYPADYVPLHPADDLARCQRYYERWDSATGAVPFCLGQVGSTTGVFGFLPFKAKKPVTPTMTASAGNTFAAWTANTSQNPCTSMGLNATTLDTAILWAVAGTANLVAGNASGIISAGSTPAYVAMEANP